MDNVNDFNLKQKFKKKNLFWYVAWKLCEIRQVKEKQKGTKKSELLNLQGSFHVIM